MSTSASTRFNRGAFWSVLGSIGSSAIRVLAFILVARALGKVGYGELGVIQSTLGMFQSITNFRIGMTATKYVAEYRDSDPQKTSRIVVFSTLVALTISALASIVLFFLGPWLATANLGAPHLAKVLQISSIILFLTTLNGALTGILAGFESFKSIARVNILSAVLSFPLLAGGAYILGIEGAVYAMALAALVNLAINVKMTLAVTKASRNYLSLRGWYQEWKVLVHFSIPAVLGSMVVGPATWACAVIIVNQPDGYAEMGLFNAANQWRTAVIYIPNILGQVALPILSSFYVKNEYSEYGKIFRYNLMINSGIATLIVVPLLLFAETIMRAYGPDFASGKLVLILLGLTSVFMAVDNLVGQAIASMGKMWISFALNAGWGCTLVFLTWSWKGSGAEGYALATLISYGLLTIGSFFFLFALHNRNASRSSHHT